MAVDLERAHKRAHHLDPLREAGIVDSERRGLWAHPTSSPMPWRS